MSSFHKLFRRALATVIWQPLIEEEFSVVRVGHRSFGYTEHRPERAVFFYSEPGQGEALVDLKELDFWRGEPRCALTENERRVVVQRLEEFFKLNGFKMVTIRTERVN